MQTQARSRHRGKGLSLWSSRHRRPKGSLLLLLLLLPVVVVVTFWDQHTLVGVCLQVWEPLLSLVSSRVVVGYSNNDWLLAFLCRGTSFSVSGACTESHALKC